MSSLYQKYVDLNMLQTYHNKLMKQLSEGRLVPINVCPNCGGIIDDMNKCEYCGAKLKLVVDDE